MCIYYILTEIDIDTENLGSGSWWIYELFEYI